MLAYRRGAAFGAESRDLAPGLRGLPFERSAIVFYVVETDHVLIASVYRRGRDYVAILRGEPPAEGED